VELVRLQKKQGIKLGTLKGKLSEQALDRIAKPLRKTAVERLFGGALDS
jgi:hypothetical protein